MKKLYWLALTGILSLALISGCPSTEEAGGGEEGGPTPEATVTPSDGVATSTEGS